MKTWIRVVKNLLHVVRQIPRQWCQVDCQIEGKLDTQRHPDSGSKSTARSMVNYDRDPDGGTKSTARYKANRDPDSGTNSTARSKANYNRNPKSGTK